MNDWRWYVYILICEDGSYYTGMSWDVSDRFEQHALSCGSKYTSRYKPVDVAYVEEHDDFWAAKERERQIKGWTRTKKEMLISGRWTRP